ncbi:unnamed protein product [Sphacelaria rigidula]
MQEEAKQAREYSGKLAQEMSRLGRIEHGLLPDQRSALETLRRLLATSTALERQEQSTLEEFRAREAALRSEIDDYVNNGGTHPGAGGMDMGPAAKTAAPGRQDGMNVVGVGQRESQPRSQSPGAGDAGTGPPHRKDSDPSLHQERLQIQQHQDQSPLDVVVSTTTSSTGIASSAIAAPQTSLEGKALLAEGLHRIEAAHWAAAGEREMLATRLSRLRLAVARRQREEDAVPGHAELLQYLLRFEELGKHARERERQLRKCQAERSTLALTREILADQSRLLETVTSGVDDAAHKHKAAREAYMHQLEGMIKGVEDSLSNQKRLLDSASDRRRTAEETREALDEEKRRFLKAMRDLTEACMKHEGLKAHLSVMRR